MKSNQKRVVTALFVTAIMFFGIGGCKKATKNPSAASTPNVQPIESGSYSSSTTGSSTGGGSKAVSSGTIGSTTAPDTAANIEKTGDSVGAASSVEVVSLAVVNIQAADTGDGRPSNGSGNAGGGNNGSNASSGSSNVATTTGVKITVNRNASYSCVGGGSDCLDLLQVYGIGKSGKSLPKLKLNAKNGTIQVPPDYQFGNFSSNDGNRWLFVKMDTDISGLLSATNGIRVVADPNDGYMLQY